MNEIVANRYTVAVAALVFAGFWLALSACMPDMRQHSGAWKPVALAQPHFRTLPANEGAKFAALSAPKANIELADASSK